MLIEAAFQPGTRSSWTVTHPADRENPCELLCELILNRTLHAKHTQCRIQTFY